MTRREPPESFDILCLSHLAWDQTLFQRPQQLMRQFARRHRVIYVGHLNTRAFGSALLKNRAALFGKPNENLTFLNVPHFPWTKRFSALRRVTDWYTALCARFLAWNQGFRRPCLWLYHPGFTAFVRRIPRRTLIYDCMDLFSAFATEHGRGGEEAELLGIADAVFTGGRSLQKAKERQNPRTYCFPSGVDFEHFEKAAEDATLVPADIRAIPPPVLGYFGAVDERIDFELLDYLCEKRPGWSVVLIGPLIGMDACPVKRPNFHYLGRKAYALLAGYLKAFDVCLMPFVDSPLTRHISPTKTPEYLAGGKPVVSTPVPDVVADYSDLVRVERDPAAFLLAVEAVLTESEKGGGDLQRQRRERLRENAAARSWEQIAEAMEQLIREIQRKDPSGK